MEQETTATTPTKQMIVFRVTDEIFATDIGVVREVIKLEEVTPVPGTPDTIAGIINIRSRIVPLLELGALLHVGQHTASKPYILLIDTSDNGVVGMIVDEVLEIRRFDVEEIKPAPKVLSTKVSADFIAGVILPNSTDNEEDVILLIDLEATISKSIADMLNQVKGEQAAAKLTEEGQ
jgi:purine-binding chemotaxis protein CheW